MPSIPFTNASFVRYSLKLCFLVLSLVADTVDLLSVQEENLENSMVNTRRQIWLRQKIEVWKNDLAAKEKTRVGLLKMWEG